MDPWFWAAKPPPPDPCPGPASASPPPWGQRGTSAYCRQWNSSEFPQCTLQHQPAPLARCAAKPPVHCPCWQQPSRWHGDTPGQPSQQLPFRVQGVAGDQGHSTETPRPAGHGNAHRRQGTETPAAPQQRSAPGLSLPSRRHSSCCHHFCLLERGGRRLAEPGRARRPGGRGSAAWCRVPGRQDPQLLGFVFSPAVTGATRGRSGATLPALSRPTPVALGQGHDPCPNVTAGPWGDWRGRQGCPAEQRRALAGRCC